MSEWNKWDETKPPIGSKVIIVCSDGCSSAPCLMGDAGPMHGEDGVDIGDQFTDGSIWTLLPEGYDLRFTQITDADWY